MKVKNETRFHIKTLNQEKLFNSLYKDFAISNVERLTENEVRFSCNFLVRKKIKKILSEKNVEILEEHHFGALSNLLKMWSSFGVIFAVLAIFVFLIVQSQFVLQYQVLGVDKLDKHSVVNFVKSNFGRTKSKLNTKDVEIALMDNFDEISFVSCSIKGQTLVVNIKEKLLPDEIYGQFKPIVSTKDAKITKIELISGTLAVKVGDIVRAGDVLVEPYTIDQSGQMMQTFAKAKIYADVYNEGTVDHYDHFVDVYRTGESYEESVVTLFGLNIYSFKSDKSFEMFEVETETHDLSKNNFLPFKLKKTIFYELKERVVESNFEDVKDEYLEKARKKALAKCADCDKIIDEYYTLRHLNGVTIVNYCITTQEEIGDCHGN